MALPEHGKFGLLLILCSTPAFLAGLTEDVTKNVSPRRRLMATAVAAGLAFWLLDAGIAVTSIPGLDWVVSFGLGAFLLTIFVVSGVANAFNIIDGFNGLAALCAVMTLACIAFVAHRVADPVLMLWALVGAGAVLGFFVWNFPRGKIFLGDGGAYFVGFYVAELAISLLSRHRQVSPLFALMVCMYPVCETVFSIYRKKFLRGMSPGMPDGVHLHMLVHKRLVRRCRVAPLSSDILFDNSMTSPYLWGLCLAAVLCATAFWDQTAMLAAGIFLFCSGYVLLYWRIVRFHTPRWMVARRRQRIDAAADLPNSDRSSSPIR